MSTVFDDDYTIPISVKIASAIGANEAIVIQQIHYWIDMFSKSNNEEVKSKHFHDGRWWVYNTYDKWHEQFPFWSVKTIQRMFGRLKDMNVIIVGEYNKIKYDHTKWYTINYEVLETLVNIDKDKMTISNRTNCPYRTGQIDPTNTIDYTKTSLSIDYQLEDSYRHFSPKVEKRTLLNFNIVERQIRKSCKNNGYDSYSDDMVETFRYFYQMYKDRTGNEHNKLSQDNIDNVVNNLILNMSECCGDFNSDGAEIMIDNYFDTRFEDGCNYSIIHFSCEDIIKNRFYQTLY